LKTKIFPNIKMTSRVQTELDIFFANFFAHPVRVRHESVTATGVHRAFHKLTAVQLYEMMQSMDADKRCFHEIYSDEPMRTQRVMFDIDRATTPEDYDADMRKMEQVINFLQMGVVAKTHINPWMLVCSSHRQDKTKISFHVIFGIHCQSTYATGLLCRNVIESIQSYLAPLDLGVSPIDKAVYIRNHGKSHSLRMLWSVKVSGNVYENRMKVFSRLIGADTPKYVNDQGYYWPWVFMLTLLSSTYMSKKYEMAVPADALMPTYKPTPVDIAGMVNHDWVQRQLEMMICRVEGTDTCAHRLLDIHYGTINCARQRKSYCGLCERVHEADNIWIYLSERFGAVHL